MKKLLVVLLASLLLTGCSSPAPEATPTPGTDGPVVIENLKVAFVPSRDPAEIVAATAPLENLLIETLATKGFDVKAVEITVGTTYDTVGEGLSAGTIDIGFIPAGTYVLFQPDGVEVLLSATRAGLSKDSEVASEWNDGLATETNSENQVNYYRSIIVAGPSEKGQELAAIVNAGEALTWDDVNSASWCHAGPTSSAGYIYPTLWLMDNFDGKNITDLETAVITTSYTDTATRIANGQCDIGVGFADFRMDNAEKWTSDYGRTESVFAETNIIGVTDGIMNDTISISNNSDNMSDELKVALSEAFIEIATTDAGKEVIAIYNHEGYVTAIDSDYDAARDAQAIVAE